MANRYCVAGTCHTSLSAHVCTSLATGTTWRMLEPPDSSPYAGIALLRIYMDTESLSFVHTLVNVRTPHTVGKLTIYLLTPLSRILNKDQDSYTRESQVNEILHMFSIHKMACNAPLDMTS